MRDAMKYATAVIGLSLIACGSCAHAPTPQDRPDTHDVPAVARLVISDLDGDTVGYCTAWKAGPDLVATAGHCCKKDRMYTLQGPNAVPGAEAFVLVDMKEDDESKVWKSDICVMRGELRGSSLRVAARDPKVGDHLWTVGYPHREYLISEGIWAGRSDDDEGVCSVVGRGGASGSPILDHENRVVGVLVAGYGDADNIVYTATVENIRAAIRKARTIKGIPNHPDDPED